MTRSLKIDGSGGRAISSPGRWGSSMISSEQAADILARVGRATECDRTREALAAAVAQILAEQIDHFDWVGIYWLDGETLRLGPYVGEATEHTRIEVGRGVCGTAVAEDANQVIDDVRTLDNYLSCSVATRSEIVVLIRDPMRRTVGQIDVDGHAVGAFDRSDEALLEAIASLIGAAPRSEDNR